jgi:hypothetical protein
MGVAILSFGRITHLVLKKRGGVQTPIAPVAVPLLTLKTCSHSLTRKVFVPPLIIVSSFHSKV